MCAVAAHTFLIIGAAKAGTTSLPQLPRRAPEISMSSEKEPVCFEPPDWHRRLGEYRELFDRAAPVRGEASIAYSAYPWTPEIPDRVRAVVPDARIVYLVRDPIERMLSHCAHMEWNRHLWGAQRSRPFDQLMEDLDDPMNTPVWCSRTATQIERWIERFGDDRVLVIDQRELLTEPPPDPVARPRVPRGRTHIPLAGLGRRAQARRPSTRLRPALARRLGRAGTPGRPPARRAPRAHSARSAPAAERGAARAGRWRCWRPRPTRLRAMTDLPLDHWTV